jgi:hypothetical protein
MIDCRAIVAVLLAAQLAGCERSATPATQPASVTATTLPATEPSASVLTIGTQEYRFPRAILRLSTVHSHLVARLSTDDPPAAIDENYRGNSFDISMPLAITDPAQLSQTTWRYTAPAGEKPEDSPHGVFLDGQRRRLHPQDVTARFESNGAKIDVILSGWFLVYETNATEPSFAAPRRIYVRGRFAASLIGK